MLRQLPPTVTADQTPDWLPVGWIAHSTVLKRGRQTKTYTHLRTGKKFSTKDQVLEYMKMERIREEREFGIHKRKLRASQDREAATETPCWLQDYWKTGSYSGNQSNTISENMSNVLQQTHSKQEVLENHNDMESEASSDENEETGCNQIAYIIDESEEDLSETEYFEYKCSHADVENLSSTPLRSQPERMQKLDSRAITQCVFEDEEMSSDSDKKLPEAKEEGCSEANALEEEAHLEEDNLRHDAVVECGDKARAMLPGLTGTFSIEINLDPEPASDSLLEKDLNKSWTEGIGARNVEIRDQQGSDLMHMNASSSMVVQLTQELGDKSEEPLKAQEEAANESRRSVFFPDREAPSHSLLVFGNSNATPSADDLIDTITPKEKNISGSRKREKNTKPCSSKNIKKKDTGKLEKRKRKQKKPQGEEKGSSSSVTMEKKPIDWPKPCPNFAFEPITRSFQEEDDSVIRRYLEQHYTAAGNSNNIPLPDFGLPSFSKIKISLNEEEPESKKMKFPDTPPCVQFASSSLDGCSFACTTMQQTVAGN